MMSEWKEGAPEEPEKKDVQIPEAEKPEENVQNGAEQEENGENMQILDGDGGDVQTAAPEQPADTVEPIPPEIEEPVAPPPAGEPEPVPAQPVPPPLQQGYPLYPQPPAAQPVQPGYAGQWQAPMQQPVYPPQPYQPYPPQPPVQYQYSQPVYQTQPVYSPYPGAPAPAKKKMSTGAKVFLIIAGIFALAGITATVLYFAFALGNNVSDRDDGPHFGYDLPDDGDSVPEDEEDPGFDITPPEEDEEESRPQVDVTPNTEGITISPRPSGETLDAEAVYNRVVTSTVTVSAKLTQENGSTGESTGTGIIATSDGYIITNSHVVLNSRSAKVTVTTFDGLEYEAVVVGVDRTTDLAVLKTNDHDFVPAEFGDAGELSVGEWVLAIGNPGGARFSSSLTRGIISGLDREVGKYSEEGMTYIQTDAAINPGNSGGPLVNMYGQVVVINSSKIVTEGYEGMGFAIPVSRAQPIINNLLSDGYIKGRTRLGIMCREVGSAMSEMYNVPRGLQITEFNEECTLIGTDAEPGDIIIAIEGETVESLRDVSNLLLRYSPGDQVTLTLYRPAQTFGQKGRELEVEITLLEDKGETQD